MINFGFGLEEIKAVLTRKYIHRDHELVGYKVQFKKDHEKRSPWDSSKHLAIYFLNEKKEICRTILSHNNNQHLKIDNYSKWFKDGFEGLDKLSIESNRNNQFHWSKDL